jgi:hypothetical protein
VGAAAVGGVLVAVAVWTIAGPLRTGWARRAGTPVSLIASFRPAPTTTLPNGKRPATTTTVPAPLPRLSLPLDTRFSGRLTQTAPDANGDAIVVIDATWPGRNAGRVHVVLQGTALSGGGVEMQRSRAYLGSIAVPTQYHGQITALHGSHVEARVSGSNHRQADLTIDLESLTGTTVKGRLVVNTRGGQDGDD